MSILGNCNATGIGSVPHTDTKLVHKMIKETMPLIPHWPQMPNKGESEGFINQYLTPLIDIGLVKVEAGKAPVFNTEREDWTDLLTEFYTIYLAASEGEDWALNKFGFGDNSAEGFNTFLENIKDGYYSEANFVKGQVSGPITLGLQVTDLERRSCYYDSQLKDILVKTLALHAKWQTLKLKELGYPVLIFIDDPGIYSLGLSTHITLTKEEIMNDLTTVFDVIHQAGGIVGSHSCASTDWSMLFESSLNVINFDAYQYFTSLSVHIDSLKKFIDKGGVLAFGIVPTSDQVWGETTETLLEKFEEQINYLVEKGVDRKTLLKQCLITPSCGTGALTVEISELVYKLTKELSAKVKANTEKM